MLQDFIVGFLSQLGIVARVTIINNCAVICPINLSVCLEKTEHLLKKKLLKILM